MIATITDNEILIKDDNTVILKFIKSGKNTYSITDPPLKEEKNSLRQIILFVTKHGKNGSKLLKILYDDYNICITRQFILRQLNLTNHHTALAKEMTLELEEIGVLKKYNTYWRVPKDKLIDLNNYFQTIKEEKCKMDE